MLTYSFVGTPENIREQMHSFTEQTGVDELFLVSAMYDHSARLRSYELVADVCGISEPIAQALGS
jgi:alkanesulfonate monooxygenase SsuD/methylene tetrahydromethanopterin reductase-like flavin-dependent oxidoreductase (luciferase family)